MSVQWLRFFVGLLLTTGAVLFILYRGFLYNSTISKKIKPFSTNRRINNASNDADNANIVELEKSSTGNLFSITQHTSINSSMRDTTTEHTSLHSSVRDDPSFRKPQDVSSDIVFVPNNSSINGTFISVDSAGKFVERVQHFNSVISALRRSTLEHRRYKPWQPLQQPVDVLWCNRDDFMTALVNYTHIRTVLLQWNGEQKATWSSLADKSNVVIQKYYRWTASEPLCEWIQTAAFTKARWDAVYNRTCITDMNVAKQATSVEPLYFHGKPINVRDYWPNEGLAYPSYFHTDYPDYVLYMHIIEDAVIVETGKV